MTIKEIAERLAEITWQLRFEADYETAQELREEIDMLCESLDVVTEARAIVCVEMQNSVTR